MRSGGAVTTTAYNRKKTKQINFLTEYKSVYDKNTDHYLVGVECDYSAHNNSISPLESDVLRPIFLQSRGWNIVRVWSRDWWLNKNKVINKIVEIAERERSKVVESLDDASLAKYKKKTTKTSKK